MGDFAPVDGEHRDEVVVVGPPGLDCMLTEPSDVQAMFDNILIADKKLHWIEGTTARWDGYLEFQRRPQPMLEWFGIHMD